MRETDKSLFTFEMRFGVAGGPDVVVLTEEGNARAFSVGAQVRRGKPAEALEALWQTQGEEGYLTTRYGAKWYLTPLGERFDQVAWGVLRELGYVESIPPSADHGDGVRLTEAGKRAAQNGMQERQRLLERCKEMVDK